MLYGAEYEEFKKYHPSFAKIVGIDEDEEYKLLYTTGPSVSIAPITILRSKTHPGDVTIFAPSNDSSMFGHIIFTTNVSLLEKFYFGTDLRLNRKQFLQTSMFIGKFKDFYDIVPIEEALNKKFLIELILPYMLIPLNWRVDGLVEFAKHHSFDVGKKAQICTTASAWFNLFALSMTRPSKSESNQIHRNHDVRHACEDYISSFANVLKSACVQIWGVSVEDLNDEMLRVCKNEEGFYRDKPESPKAAWTIRRNHIKETILKLARYGEFGGKVSELSMVPDAFRLVGSYRDSNDNQTLWIDQTLVDEVVEEILTHEDMMEKLYADWQKSKSSN